MRLWPQSARAELRAIERDAAVRILLALTEFADAGAGDVTALAGGWQGHFRLRVADYRVILTISSEEITIIRVRHRSDVYR